MVEEKVLENDKIRQSVREAYSRRVNDSPISSCCGPAAPAETPTLSCCGSTAPTEPSSLNTCSTGECGGVITLPPEQREQFLKKYSAQLGYTEDDLENIPDGANLALGCGNPTAHASIKEGETVLDLGSGGGLDCFIAANKVGATGKVIGVDMTPAMLSRARENAAKSAYNNVEFRLGEIENLPVADNSVDLIISNCVINLSPDKEQVFREAFRVLKPGGRLMVSDIVLLKELPDEIRNDAQAYASCIGGAIMKDKYLGAIKDAGFKDVEIMQKSDFSTTEFLLNDDEIREALGDQIEKVKELDQLDFDSTSIKVKAIKP
ncbi:MAG: arsenite methyltransferase [Promethearchaeota archaeon]|jgi:ubiquinone/menaquinone biosynthesis C-methylase UbiE